MTLDRPPLTLDAAAYAALAKEDVPCACCGSRDLLSVVGGDRHGLGLQTVVCRRCGLLFTSPRPQAEWFSQFYRFHYRQCYEEVTQPDERYLRRDWIAGRHRRNVEMLTPLAAPTGSLLDVGAADGTFLHQFRTAHPGWKVEGLEPSVDFSRFAQHHYGLDSIRCGDLDDLLPTYPPAAFDLVTASHVLEHLMQPGRFLEMVRRVLRPGGLLFLDVPDAEGRKHGIWNLHIAHLYHFSRQSLTNLLEKHGFVALAARRGLERPDPWTLQVVARMSPELPERWTPPAVHAERIARAFRRHVSTTMADRARLLGRRIAWSVRKRLSLR
jgi:2-polyprenyl-3-methyl-5-hydroxy-6-metoxy-1,4-benzoquinol methylase